MKLRIIVTGIIVFLLIGTIALARSNYQNGAEDICSEEMIEEQCTDDMMESGSCDMMMQKDHPSSMMEDCADLPGSDIDQSMIDSCPMMQEAGSSHMMM